MAKKIRSWEEYDAVVKEREQNFAEQVESRLEKLIAANPWSKANRQKADFHRKKARGAYRLVRGQPVSVEDELLEAIANTKREFEKLIFKDLEPKLQPQAERDVIFSIVGDNLHNSTFAVLEAIRVVSAGFSAASPA